MIELYLYINYQTNLIWKRSVLVHDKLSFIEVVVISMRNEIEIQYIIVKKNYETKFDTAVYLKYEAYLYFEEHTFHQKL